MAMKLGKCIASFMAVQHGTWDLGFLVRQLLGLAIRNVLLLHMNFGQRCGDVAKERLYTCIVEATHRPTPSTTRTLS
eukprot:3129178-Karenia_brevis.AAC.1